MHEGQPAQDDSPDGRVARPVVADRALDADQLGERRRHDAAARAVAFGPEIEQALRGVEHPLAGLVERLEDVLDPRRRAVGHPVPPQRVGARHSGAEGAGGRVDGLDGQEVHHPEAAGDNAQLGVGQARIGSDGALGELDGAVVALCAAGGAVGLSEALGASAGQLAVAVEERVEPPERRDVGHPHLATRRIGQLGGRLLEPTPVRDRASRAEDGPLAGIGGIRDRRALGRGVGEREDERLRQAVGAVPD